MDASSQDEGTTDDKSRTGGRRARRRAKAAALGMTAAVAVPTVRRRTRRLRRVARIGLMVAVAAAAVKWALRQRATRDAYLEGPTDQPAGEASTGLASTLSHTATTDGAPTGSGPDDLIDLTTAAQVLQVDESRIQVMVSEGLLTPVGAGGDAPRFHEAEVQSVRLLGG
jgi:hypothetical protein